MEKVNKEIYNNELLELGAAMLALLNGRVLNDCQIEIIKGANDRQKVLGMQLMTANNLSGQKYTNYCHNMRKISRRQISVGGKAFKKSSL